MTKELWAWTIECSKVFNKRAGAGLNHAFYNGRREKPSMKRIRRWIASKSTRT